MASLILRAPPPVGAAAARALSPRARRQQPVLKVTLAIFLWLVLIRTQSVQELLYGQALSTTDTVAQAGFSVLFVILLVAHGMPTRRELFVVPTSIMIFLGYCCFTLIWSIDLSFGARRLLSASVVIWLVFRYVYAFGPDLLLYRFRQAMIAMLIVNFLVALFSPSGIHTYAFGDEPYLLGNWRGMMPHKNIAGAACALTILLFLFDNRHFSRTVSAFVVVGAAIFLFYTNSRTSGGVALCAILLAAASRRYNVRYRLLLSFGLLIFAVVVFWMLWSRVDGVIEMLDDPGALTGRGAIWPLLLEYASRYPWTGAGFGSFWTIDSSSPIRTLTTGWVAESAPHGHNGYLDLLVTIGVPGLVLAMIVLVIWPLLRLMLSQSIAAPRRALLFGLMVFCIGHNLTESTLMVSAMVVQVFLILAIAIIHHDSGLSPGQHQRIRRRIARLLPHAPRQPFPVRQRGVRSA